MYITFKVKIYNKRTGKTRSYKIIGTGKDWKDAKKDAGSYAQGPEEKVCSIR